MILQIIEIDVLLLTTTMPSGQDAVSGSATTIRPVIELRPTNNGTHHVKEQR